jgi:hypothetical protein
MKHNSADYLPHGSSPGLVVVAGELRRVAGFWLCYDNAGRDLEVRPGGRPAFRPFDRGYGGRPRWGQAPHSLHICFSTYAELWLAIAPKLRPSRKPLAGRGG